MPIGLVASALGNAIADYFEQGKELETKIPQMRYVNRLAEQLATMTPIEAQKSRQAMALSASEEARKQAKEVREQQAFPLEQRLKSATEKHLTQQSGLLASQSGLTDVERAQREFDLGVTKKVGIVKPTDYGAIQITPEGKISMSLAPQTPKDIAYSAYMNAYANKLNSEPARLAEFHNMLNEEIAKTGTTEPSPDQLETAMLRSLAMHHPDVYEKLVSARAQRSYWTDYIKSLEEKNRLEAGITDPRTGLLVPTPSIRARVTGHAIQMAREAMKSPLGIGYLSFGTTAEDNFAAREWLTKRFAYQIATDEGYAWPAPGPQPPGMVAAPNTSQGMDAFIEGLKNLFRTTPGPGTSAPTLGENLGAEIAPQELPPRLPQRGITPVPSRQPNKPTRSVQPPGQLTPLRRHQDVDTLLKQTEQAQEYQGTVNEDRYNRARDVIDQKSKEKFGMSAYDFLKKRGFSDAQAEIELDKMILRKLKELEK